MLLGSGRLEVTHWVRSERLRPQIAMLVVQGLITARTVEILIFLRCRQAAAGGERPDDSATGLAL